MIKKFMLSLFVLLLFSAVFAAVLFADEYYFIFTSTVEDGEAYAIISGVIEAEDDTYDVGIENQFTDWLEAYSEEVCGVAPYNFSWKHCFGPYESRSEADRERRDKIGDFNSDDYRVYDIPRLSVPPFRYYDD